MVSLKSYFHNRVPTSTRGSSILNCAPQPAWLVQRGRMVLGGRRTLMVSRTSLLVMFKERVLFNLDLRSTASVARPAWPTGPWRLQDLDGHGIVYLTGRCGSWPHLNVVLHLRSTASVARSAWPTSSAAAGPCWSRNCLSHRSGRRLGHTYT
jgi:hypothetical protein